MLYYEYLGIFCSLDSKMHKLLFILLEQKRGNDMFTEQKLEQHYTSMPSNVLQILRDEYKWALEECGVHNEEQIRYIEKALSLRGENITSNRKLLFLCSCGQSRIVTTDVPEDKIKMFIFDQYNVPCPKCRKTHLYSWKYMD